jgi:hypothetical protein
VHRGQIGVQRRDVGLQRFARGSDIGFGRLGRRRLHHRLRLSAQRSRRRRPHFRRCASRSADFAEMSRALPSSVYIIRRVAGAKGKSGGRTIPMNAELHAALLALREVVPDKVRADWPIAYSERGGYSAASIVNLFDRWYRELGFQGASSHSGRRTFITAAAIEPIRTPAMHHVEEQGRQAARAPECLEIMSRLPFSAFPWSTKKCASALFRRAADAL